MVLIYECLQGTLENARLIERGIVMKIILDNGLELSIKAARVNANLNQTETAEALGLSKGGYIKKESGITRFYLSELTKLSNLLNIPLDYFCEDECLRETQVKDC